MAGRSLGRSVVAVALRLVLAAVRLGGDVVEELGALMAALANSGH